MAMLRLIRQPFSSTQPNAPVRGTLFLIDYDLLAEMEVPKPLCPTLENASFIIPPGRYRLTVTYSPKFKRDLPLVNNVPNRSAIRFHPGTRPEHSKGCILISRHDEQQLKTLIQAEKVVLLEVK